MTAIAWITVGTTIGIVSRLIYLRVRNRPQRDLPSGSSKRAHSPQPATGATSKYGAVSLWPCLEACGAAWKLQGERFLSSDKPPLPLAGCDQATCECQYRQHSDRRLDEDRRDTWGRFGGFLPRAENDERRVRKDRRTKARSD